MIAEQHDDRVVAVCALIERVENAPDLAVDVGDGCEVALNGLPPASGFEHQFVI